MPLALHFLLASQAEAIEAFGRANVAEHRPNHRHAVAVDLFALWAIDSVFHPVRVVGQAFVLDSERDLPRRALAMVGGSGILHKLVLLRAVAVLQQSALEMHSNFTILGFACALITGGVTRWADASQVYRI